MSKDKKKFKINIKNKHKHFETFQDVYVGRGSILGNPFTHRKNSKAEKIVSSREEAISLYRQYFYEKIKNDSDFSEAIKKIENKLKFGDVNLVCYCHPLPCHAEIIKTYIYDKENNS